VGILGGIFFSENYCRIYSSITVLLCSSVISDHEQPIRCNSVGSQLPRRCMRCEAAKPRANQAPSWRGDTPSDKVLSGVMRGWFPLVPPSPPFPFAVSAQIRMAVVTTRCVSTLTDFYDLHLSPLPCWALDARFLAGLAATLPTDPHSLTNSHVHWPSAPGSGPAAWSATESPSHGTLGFNLMVALGFAQSRGRSPLASISDRK
jgi:hypothetical protein